MSIPESDVRNEKSADAFRTITEVADLLDVQQHVLRFWETKFTQIKPMKRAGGRRYYRPDDVRLLEAIRLLLHEEGYTIRGVQKILRENGVKYLLDGMDGETAPTLERIEAQADPAAPRASAPDPDPEPARIEDPDASALSHAPTARTNSLQSAPASEAVSNEPKKTIPVTVRLSPQTASNTHRKALMALRGELRELRDMLRVKP